MGTYRPLYSLRVEHDYYDNLACRALAFRLKASGVDLCRRRGLLFRQTAVNEWTLLYDCDSAGVDTSSDKVEAELCITDPAFVLFTDWAALRPENAYTPVPSDVSSGGTEHADFPIHLSEPEILILASFGCHIRTDKDTTAVSK
ncbi:hypothetical protein H6B14_03935 [Phocaeicola coprophilus]|nr:hypothetical protein [Phocaeicola coprophilus]